MAKKKSEIAVRDNTLPSKIVFDQELVENQVIDNEDILIPKIWLMQQMSELVTLGNAKSGEFRDSLTGDALDAPLEVFLFAPYKTWQVTKQVKGKKKAEYIETLNYYDHPDLEIEEEDQEGNLIHRDKVLGFFCLLANKLDVEPFPYVIDFKRTSRRTGQALITKIAKLRARKMPCYATTFNINSKPETNDLGTYFIKTVEMGRPIEQDEVGIVEDWIKTINAAQAERRVVVDDTDLKKDNAGNKSKAKSKVSSKKQKF